jgi:predicted amidohydrolase
MNTLKVAVAQLSVRRAEPAANIAVIIGHLIRAAEADVKLVVFPECALTGYVFDSRAETEAAALSVDGPELGAVVSECKRLGIHAVVGLLERREGHVYNTAALLGPEGVIGVYRKRHLPPMGADRFTDEPDDLEPVVFDTVLGRIGIFICYEIRFPEVARTLALAGADLIALPTNWPVQSAILADLFTRVRAAENLVYLLVSNRCDEEQGIQFLGSSQIVSPSGEVVVHAGHASGLFMATVDLDLSRTKRVILDGGEIVLAPWEDRRPEAYRL